MFAENVRRHCSGVKAVLAKRPISSPPGHQTFRRAIWLCHPVTSARCSGPLLHQHSLFARVPILCNYSI